VVGHRAIGEILSTLNQAIRQVCIKTTVRTRMSFFTFTSGRLFTFLQKGRSNGAINADADLFCAHEAMHSHLNAPLNRRLALILALLSLWLVGALGSLLLSGWQFVGLDDDANAIFQVGLFYLARAAALLPSATLAGIILAKSKFARPVLAAFLTVAGNHAASLVLRAAFRWPWSAVPGVSAIIPVAGELVSIFLLAACGALSAFCVVKFTTG